MVKLNNFGQPQPNQQANSNQNAQFQSNQSQTQTQFQEQPAQTNQQKGLISIPPALMQIIPWIPFALEAMTGQKIPAIGGTIGEIQSALQRIESSLSLIYQSQQQITARLESLENNASNQLTNLSQQVASTNKSFHLLATETKRSLEFNPRPPAEQERNSYQEPETY